MANDISTETETDTPEELANRFAALTAQWRRECRHTSKIKTMRECPAYLELVAMGQKAIPLILADLEKNGGFGFLALAEITKTNPVPKEGAGKIDQMTAAWIAWGREQGYRW